MEEKKNIVVAYGSEENMYEPEVENFDSREDAIEWVRTCLREDLEDAGEEDIDNAVEDCFDKSSNFVGDTGDYAPYRQVYFIGTKEQAIKDITDFREEMIAEEFGDEDEEE